MHLTLNIIHVHEAQKSSEQGEQESESARARTSRREFFSRLPSLSRLPLKIEPVKVAEHSFARGQR